MHLDWGRAATVSAGVFSPLGRHRRRSNQEADNPILRTSCRSLKDFVEGKILALLSPGVRTWNWFVFRDDLDIWFAERNSRPWLISQKWRFWRWKKGQDDVRRNVCGIIVSPLSITDHSNQCLSLSWRSLCVTRALNLCEYQLATEYGGAP